MTFHQVRVALLVCVTIFVLLPFAVGITNEGNGELNKAMPAWHPSHHEDSATLAAHEATHEMHEHGHAHGHIDEDEEEHSPEPHSEEDIALATGTSVSAE
eukprot:CAMPEP_0197863438 /NCGR_PEP_ID=MMETSP1438-20131217/40894_1 /TAXON_ID=1461541 /ORGANISM="Pterosperma sp., Strain CCMP1384" /LENGTH=99 /DNA_ID=CAMNT_0043481327 /DNA_START=8 /DNA_END=304 /DNA_ORIENTATION=-